MNNNLNKRLMQASNLKVVGIGGAGGNVINYIIEEGVDIVAEHIAINTAKEDLSYSLAQDKILMGSDITKGLGMGSNLVIGKKAALESKEEIKKVLKEADVVFAIAGMGSGTGTGASPVIVKIAQELGALTIGVVTLPYAVEGPNRMKIALEGVEQLKPYCDKLFIIDNEKLIYYRDENTTLLEAFRESDKAICNKQIQELLSNKIIN